MTMTPHHNHPSTSTDADADAGTPHHHNHLSTSTSADADAAADETRPATALACSTSSSTSSAVIASSVTTPTSSNALDRRQTTSSVLRGLSFLVTTAKAISDVSFAAAKMGTQVGIGIARVVVDGVGEHTGLEHTGVTPAISAILNVAEKIATTSIDVGKFWTGFGLHSAASSLRTLDHVVGDTDTARAIEEFAKLVHAEISREACMETGDGAVVTTDGTAPKVSVADVGFVETLRAVMALVCLQRLTRAEWKARSLAACGPSIKMIHLNNPPSDPWGTSSGTDKKESPTGPIIVELNDDATELDLNDIDFSTSGGENGMPTLPQQYPSSPASSSPEVDLAIGQVGSPTSDAISPPEEGEDEGQRTWREIRRYIRFATGAYGRHIVKFLRGENPIPDIVSRRSDPYSHSNRAKLLADDTFHGDDAGDDPDLHPERRFYAHHTRTRLPDVVHSTFHDQQPNHLMGERLSGEGGSRIRETPPHKDPGDSSPPPTDESIFTRPQTLHYHPTFFLILDHPNRSIVVALRGTLSFHDVMVDLTCSYQPVPFHGKEHHVHSGMYKAAVSISFPPTRDDPRGDIFGFRSQRNPRVFEAVRECLRRYPAYQLILTGHSLGAGIASLVALHWGDPDTGRVALSSGLVPSTVQEPPRFHCYAFASPAIVAPSLSPHLTKIVTTVIHGVDMVPRLSLGGVRDVASLVVWMHRRPKLVGALLSSSLGAGVGDLDGDGVDEGGVGGPVELRRRLVETCFRNEKLVPAGRVVWTLEEEEGGDGCSVRVVEDLGVVFGEMELGVKMLVDHMPNVYEGVLRGV
ncbi:hypothetical protein HDU67_006437 [Dinochytrium kinnereticum]|nr:hypothetical protein HDU67_006437 [Dinochytrium kinnereticum]